MLNDQIVYKSYICIHSKIMQQYQYITLFSNFVLKTSMNAHLHKRPKLTNIKVNVYRL